jgi:hypothetical protein
MPLPSEVGGWREGGQGRPMWRQIGRRDYYVIAGARF